MKSRLRSKRNKTFSFDCDSQRQLSAPLSVSDLVAMRRLLRTCEQERELAVACDDCELEVLDCFLFDFPSEFTSNSLSIQTIGLNDYDVPDGVIGAEDDLLAITSSNY